LKATCRLGERCIWPMQAVWKSRVVACWWIVLLPGATVLRPQTHIALALHITSEKERCIYTCLAVTATQKYATAPACPLTRALLTTPSKYLMWPRQSQPKRRLLATNPMPANKDTNTAQHSTAQHRSQHRPHRCIPAQEWKIAADLHCRASCMPSTG
jgi:hypothetical protein